MNLQVIERDGKRLWVFTMSEEEMEGHLQHLTAWGVAMKTEGKVPPDMCKMMAILALKHTNALSESDIGQLTDPFIKLTLSERRRLGVESE